MKRIILLITFFLGACALINAQSVQRATLKYTPSGDDVFKGVGYEVNIPFAWGFFDCYGEVHIAFAKKTKEATSSVYIYKGKRYTAMQVIGQQFFPKPQIGLTDLTADVYDGAHRLGSVKLGNVTGFTVGCFGETYRILKMIDVDEKAYKDKLSSLSLKNVRIAYCHTNDSPIESKIDKLLLGKEFESIVQQADDAFNLRDYEKAKELYTKANRGRFDEFDRSHAKEQLEKIKEIEKIRKEKKTQEIEKAKEEERSKEEEKTRREEEANSNSNASNSAGEATSNSESSPEATNNTSSDNNTASNSSNSSNNTSSNSNSSSNSSSSNVSVPTADYSEVAVVAVVAAIALATVYASYEIGKLIYTDLDDYDVRMHKGNSDRLATKIGFTATSSSMGSYYQTSTLDLEGGVGYWPLYGDNFGFGGSATLSAGVGIFYQNAQLSADGGLMAYYGSKNLRGVFEYHQGFRRFSVFQWMFDDLSGAQNEFYRRFMAGVSFNAPGSFYGNTQAYFDLLAIYENFNTPVEFGGHNNFQPLGQDNNYGLRINLRFEDRINFYVETVLRDRDGIYIKIGGIRNLDIFGMPGNLKKPSKLIEAEGKKVIYPLVTSFHWANEKSSLDSTMTTSSNISSNFGCRIEKDFNINENWSAQGGVGLSILHNTRYNNYRYKHSSLNLSAGIRYSEHLSNKADKYWILAGINNRINIQKSISEGSSSTPLESIEINSFVPQWMFGAGLDYTIGKLGMRSGIQYERTIGSLYKDNYKSLTSNTISFNWGFMF